MAKTDNTVISMGDAPITKSIRPGKGYKKPRVVKEGEYVGVDRDDTPETSRVKKG